MSQQCRLLARAGHISQRTCLPVTLHVGVETRRRHNLQALVGLSTSQMWVKTRR